MLSLPCFFMVGTRPVKCVRTSSGGMDVLAWDWEGHEFVSDLSCLDRILGGETEVGRR